MPGQDLAVELERPDDAAAASTPGTVDTASAAATRDRPVPAFTRLRIGFVRHFLVFYARILGMSGLYRLGRAFGTLEYLVDYNRRRRVHRKLQSLFGDEMDASRRRRAAWKYFMRVRCDKMFYTIMDRIPRGKLLNRIKIRGLHCVDDGLARGKGLYVALSHYGSHHVAGLMMALRGYKIVGVRDAKESHVRRYIQQKYRETFPEVRDMTLLLANSFPRMLFRHLQSGAIVASLLDVDRRRGERTKTYPVTFFGQERLWLTGPVQIAIRCGAPILQGFVVSRKNFYYQLIPTTPLIDPDEAAALPEEEVIQRVMHHYAANVEAFVREHPDHIMNI